MWDSGVMLPRMTQTRDRELDLRVHELHLWTSCSNSRVGRLPGTVTSQARGKAVEGELSSTQSQEATELQRHCKILTKHMPNAKGMQLLAKTLGNGPGHVLAADKVAT